MRFKARRCVAVSLCCTIAILALTFLQTPYSFYYGDSRLVPYEKYFVPSPNQRMYLNHSFLITSDVCSQTGGPYLLIMVMSMANMTSQRKAIRTTWGSVARTGQFPGHKGHLDVKLVFLFGKNDVQSNNDLLKTESATEGDIVQASFKESYDNLTLKVLMGYKWVERNCPKTKFVMKMDEDVILNIPYFISQLNSTDWSNHILGPLSFSEFVIRDGKYRANKSEYFPDIYPPHVKGNLYVMQRSVAIRLLNTAPHMPYLRIEDAFITGVLAKVHSIRHVDIPEALYDRQIPASYCDIVNKVKVMSQKYTPIMMQTLWLKLKDNVQCSKLNVFIDYFIG